MKYSLALFASILFTVLVYSIPPLTEKESVKEDIEFSPAKLKLALWLYGVKNSDIVYRQAILETGNFTSDIFKENRNLFGMKHPYKRSTTSLGKHRGHAKYSGWLESVRDMAHFQAYYHHRISVSKDYYDFLDQIYAEDGSYTKKLKKLKL